MAITASSRPSPLMSARSFRSGSASLSRSVTRPSVNAVQFRPSLRIHFVPSRMSISPSRSMSPLLKSSFMVTGHSVLNVHFVFEGSPGISSACTPPPPLCQENTTCSLLLLPKLSTNRPCRKSPEPPVLMLVNILKLPEPSFRAQAKLWFEPAPVPCVPKISRSPSQSKSWRTAILFKGHPIL